MSIASNFRNKMDVAIISADASRGDNPDARRTLLFKAIEDAGFILMEREMMETLMLQAIINDMDQTDARH